MLHHLLGQKKQGIALFCLNNLVQVFQQNNSKHNFNFFTY